ncbi:hypothetical protein RUM44_002111 [Polyplax serrata]|uniref:Uncharacterized protein n=1 Tax=Polyplax serrata TaxID=468196 RepID=A0ABR1ALY2_POLSC
MSTRCRTTNGIACSPSPNAKDSSRADKSSEFANLSTKNKSLDFFFWRIHFSRFPLDSFVLVPGWNAQKMTFLPPLAMQARHAVKGESNGMNVNPKPVVRVRRKVLPAKLNRVQRTRVTRHDNGSSYENILLVPPALALYKHTYTHYTSILHSFIGNSLCDRPASAL